MYKLHLEGALTYGVAAKDNCCGVRSDLVDLRYSAVVD